MNASLTSSPSCTLIMIVSNHSRNPTVRILTFVVADVPNGIAAKKAVPGKNISTISICQLVVATNAVMYYIEIRRMHDFYNMH